MTDRQLQEDCDDDERMVPTVAVQEVAVPNPSLQLPDYLLTRTRIDEAKINQEAKKCQIAAEFARLNQALSLCMWQAEDLLVPWTSSVSVPVESVPMSAQVLEIVHGIAKTKGNSLYALNQCLRTEPSEACKKLLPRFLQLHKTALSEKDTEAIFTVMQVSFATLNLEFDSHLDRFTQSLTQCEAWLDMQTKHSQYNISSEQFMTALWLLPLDHSEVEFTHEWYTSKPPLDLIDLKAYLGDTFQSVQQMREDKRSVREIVTDLSKTSSQPYVKLIVGVIWTRLVKDPESLRQAMRLSLKAALWTRAESPKAAKMFDPEGLQMLLTQADGDLQGTVLELMSIQRLSLQQKFIQFFQSQFVTDNDQTSFEQSIFHNVLTQIRSVKCQVVDGKIVVSCGEGLLDRQAIVHNSMLRNAVCQFTQFGRQMIRKKEFADKLYELEFGILAQPPLEWGDKKVLHTSKLLVYQMLSSLSICIPHEQLSHIEDFVATWCGLLQSDDHYWPPYDGCMEPTQITFEEKAEIIAYTLQMWFKIPRGQIGRLVPTPLHSLSQDFGARVIQSKLFKVFEETVASIADQPAPKSVDKVITAFTKLATFVFDQNPSTVSQLEENGTLSKLFGALQVWHPQNKPTLVLPECENIKVILKLFSVLIVTDAGEKYVKSHGVGILRRVFESKTPSHYMYQEINDEYYNPIQLNFVSSLLQKAPEVMQLIRDHTRATLEVASADVDQLVKEFDELLPKYGNNAQIAKNVHMDSSVQITTRVNQCLKYLLLMTKSFSEERGGEEHRLFLSVMYAKCPLNQLLDNPKEYETILTRNRTLLDVVEKLGYLERRQQLATMKDVVEPLFNGKNNGPEMDAHHNPFEGQRRNNKSFDIIVENVKCALDKFIGFNTKSHVESLPRADIVNLRILLDFFKSMQSSLNVVGVEYDWYREIDILVNFLRVMKQKQIQFTLEVLTNPSQKLLPLSRDTDFSLLSATDKTEQNFDKIHSIFSQTQASVNKHVNALFGDRSREFTKDLSQFFTKILESTTERHNHRHMSNSQQKNKTANQVQMGKCMSNLAQELNCDLNRSVLVQNDVLLGILSFFQTNFQTLDMFTLTFIAQKGVEKVCELHMSLLRFEQVGSLEFHDNLTKYIFYKQLNQTGCILKAVMAAQMPRQSTIDRQLKDYTGKPLSQIMLDHYAGVYETAFRWSDLDQGGLNTILWHKGLLPDTFLYSTLFTLLDAPWESQKYNFSNALQDEKERRAKEMQKREPTSHEISALFDINPDLDPDMARAAIKMAGFNINEAVLIIINRQEELLAFIQKEQQQALQEAIDKLMNPSANNLHQAEVMTAERMKTLSADFQRKLFDTLLHVTEKTIISPKQALNLMDRIDKVDPDFLDKLTPNNASLMFQVCIVMLRRQEPPISRDAVLKTLQLANLSTDALFYLCLLLQKMDTNASEVKRFYLHLLTSPDCDQRVKDLVAISIQLQASKLKPAEARDLCLSYIEKSTGGYSRIMMKLCQMAMYSDESSVELIGAQLRSNFKSLFVHKTELGKPINQSIKFEECQFDLKSLYEQLSLIAHDQLDLVKQVLSAQCKFLQINTKVNCRLIEPELPNFNLQKLLHDKKLFEKTRAESKLLSKVTANERLVFDILIQQFRCGSSYYHTEINKQTKEFVKLMPKKFYLLRFLAQMSRVFPHLTSLFVELKDFPQLLLQEVAKTVDAVNKVTTLYDILNPLLQVDICTSPEQFCAKVHLKRLLFQEAASDFQQTQSLASLVLLYTLVPVSSELTQYNFNVSIEYLVLETPFMRCVQEYFSRDKKEDDCLDYCVETLYKVCEYIKQRKTAKKAKEPVEEPAQVPPVQPVQPAAANQDNVPSEGDSSHEDDAPMNEPADDEEPEDEDSAQEDDDEDDDPLDAFMQNQQPPANIIDEVDDYGMEEGEDDYDEEEPVNEQELAIADRQMQDILMRPVDGQERPRLAQHQVMHFGMDSEYDDIRERMMQVFATSGIERAEMMVEEMGLGAFNGGRPFMHRYQPSRNSNETWSKVEREAQKLLHSLYFEQRPRDSFGDYGQLEQPGLIGGVYEPYSYKFEVLRPLKPAIVQFELRSLLNSVSNSNILAEKNNVQKVLQAGQDQQQDLYQLQMRRMMEEDDEQLRIGGLGGLFGVNQGRGNLRDQNVDIDLLREANSPAPVAHNVNAQVSALQQQLSDLIEKQKEESSLAPLHEASASIVSHDASESKSRVEPAEEMQVDDEVPNLNFTGVNEVLPESVIPPDVPAMQPIQPLQSLEEPLPQLPPLQIVPDVPLEVSEVQQPEQPIAQEQPVPAQQHEEPDGSAFDQIEEAKQEQVAQEADPDWPFAISRQVLIEHEVDPDVFMSLTEDLQQDIISSIQPVEPQPPVQQQAQEQHAAQENLYGIDPQFLQALPPEMQAEIIEDHRRQQQRAIDEANRPAAVNAQIDMATFIQSIQDPQLRAETFLQMDEATFATLPQALQDEGNAFRRRHQQRLQESAAFLQQQARNLMMHQDEEYRRNNWNPLQPNDLLNKKKEIKTLDELIEASPTIDDCHVQIYTIAQRMKPEHYDAVLAKLKELNLTQDLVQILDQLLSSPPTTLEFKPKFDIIGLVCELSRYSNSAQNPVITYLTSQIQKNLAQLCKPHDQKEDVDMTFIDTSSSSKPDDQLLVKLLILLTCVRILCSVHSSLTTQVVIDFLRGDQTHFVSQLCEYLTKRPLPDKHQTVIVQQYLQTTLVALLSVHEKTLKAADVQVNASQVSTLISTLEFEKLNKHVAFWTGAILTKLSAKKSENWTLIYKLLQATLTESQNKVIKALHQSVPKDTVAPDLSLKRQPSQQSESNKQIVVLSSADLQSIQSSLVQTESLLQQICRIQSFYKTFGDSVYKTPLMTADLEEMERKYPGHLSQLNALNLVLASLSQQKNMGQALLQSLGQHANCVFQAYVKELDKIKGPPADQKETRPIQMQPIIVQPSVCDEKKQVAISALKREVDLSDSLYEVLRFCLMNKDLLNRILDACDKAKQPCEFLQYISYMPNIMNFKRKQAWFRHEIKKGYRATGKLNVDVRREHIFTDAYKHLMFKSSQDMRKPLYIRYSGEAGIDATGLTRDFYTELSKAMLNTQYFLFTLTSNGVTFHPDQQSHVNSDHLNYFKFIGKVIGKAIYDNQLLELQLSKPLYKMMVGEDLTFEDLKDFDNEFYRSYVHMINSDVNDLGLTFSVVREYFGKYDVVNLKENGQNIAVTNETKIEYLEKIGFYQMYERTKDQINAFLSGFHELIPKQFAQIFTASELELIISGLPDVDLNDLRNNTEYQGYTSKSPQVAWLFRTLEQMTREEIGRFLQFVTGCSRVPLAGFAALQGMRGVEKFTIVLIKEQDRLPQGHTCFNTLDLPEYPSYEVLRERVLYAIMNTGSIEQA